VPEYEQRKEVTRKIPLLRSRKRPEETAMSPAIERNQNVKELGHLRQLQARRAL
jgi:hypothetical protein